MILIEATNRNFCTQGILSQKFTATAPQIEIPEAPQIEIPEAPHFQTLPVSICAHHDFQTNFPSRPIEKGSDGVVVSEINSEGVHYISKEHKLDGKERKLNAINELVCHEFIFTAASKQLVSPKIGLGAHYICPLYRSVRTPKSAFIIMEKGQPLFNWVRDNWDEHNLAWNKQLQSKPSGYFRNHKSPWEKTVQSFAREMVLALRYIHALGLSHGDIKLENMVKVGNTVKLIDFESCRPCNGTSRLKKGTQIYCSAEYESGLHDPQKNDIWALGVTLYSILFKGPIYEVANPTDDRFCLLVADSQYDQFPVSPQCAHAFLQNGTRPNFEGLLRLYGKRQFISDEGINFLSMFWRPENTRCTLDELLNHRWLKDIDHPTNSTLYDRNPSEPKRVNIPNLAALYQFCSNLSYNFEELINRTKICFPKSSLNDILETLSIIYPTRAKKFKLSFYYRHLLNKYRGLLDLSC